MRDKVVNFQSSSVYDEEIKNKKRNLELLYDVVGDNPLKHIDWIIENGLEKFNQWYRSYEDGSIERVKRETNRKESGRILINYEHKKVSPKENVVLCQSVVEGSLRYISKLTGDDFYWSEYGDICKVPMKELVYLVENSHVAKYIKVIDPQISSQINMLSLDSSLASRNRARELQSKIGMEIGFLPASREQKEADAILRQCLSAKDYRLYSPANRMKVEVELRGGVGNKVIARYEESSPYGDMFS